MVELTATSARGRVGLYTRRKKGLKLIPITYSLEPWLTGASIIVDP